MTTLHLKCSLGHEQTIQFDMPRVDVERIGGLLDGSSPFFVHPPAPDSLMHKCGICGAPFKATVPEDTALALVVRGGACKMILAPMQCIAPNDRLRLNAHGQVERTELGDPDAVAWARTHESTRDATKEIEVGVFDDPVEVDDP